MRRVARRCGEQVTGPGMSPAGHLASFSLRFLQMVLKNLSDELSALRLGGLLPIGAVQLLFVPRAISIKCVSASASEWSGAELFLPRFANSRILAS